MSQNLPATSNFAETAKFVSQLNLYNVGRLVSIKNLNTGFLLFHIECYYYYYYYYYYYWFIKNTLCSPKGELHSAYT